MKLLFLGDSITDAYHCFDPENLGEGYVRMIHDKLQQIRMTSDTDFVQWQISVTTSSTNVPSDFVISNKGIDGFTVPRVYDMWQNIPDKTCWDVVSVLVGVNDVGVWMDRGHSDSWIKEAVRKFACTYEDMVTDILDYGIKNLILMEPFIFSYPEKYRVWQPWLEEISGHIQNIAVKYELIFLPLQTALTESAKKEGYPAITLDGIHLTEKGNQILADMWLAIFQKFC